MPTRKSRPAAAEHPALAAIRKEGHAKVKVAVSDIDGILRGKVLHKDKFASAVEGGFGFCDVVYGWDLHDQCYDNTTYTGWHKGYPDAMVRLDLATHRNVPWDGGIDFFLGNFVHRVNGREEPHPLDGRQLLKRVIARAAKSGVQPMCSLEFEFFNFAETPQSWADKKGVGPEPITPGMFGYSLLRMSQTRADFFNALMDELERVPRADRGPPHRDRPRRATRRRSSTPRRSRRPTARCSSSRAPRRSAALRHHAELHGQVEPAAPRLQRPHHQSLSDGKREHLPRSVRAAPA
jgi:hypothetical protein